MGKKWQIRKQLTDFHSPNVEEELVEEILKDRDIRTPKERDAFLNPPDPTTFSAKDVGIDPAALKSAIARMKKGIKDKESIVVYADYDADGITAGAVLWETLWRLGARAMPYVPHRVEEGYGLSEKGIDSAKNQFDPTLLITVDHGITARKQVAYAKKLGIDVIVTDHHVKPPKLPDCRIVHTTVLSGSGVSWFVAKELMASCKSIPGIKASLDSGNVGSELLTLPAIGTIADLLPLVGVNRSIIKYGLEAIRNSTRVGLNALITEAGIEKKSLDTYAVSHMLAPRLNAMGRLEHALDALRLLCTKDEDKARLLAEKLGLTNKERQQLTIDTVAHAKGLVPETVKKIIFISHETYNPGVIGLVAGRLVEEYYRPAVVLSIGDGFAKASARSIPGFNIVEAIRTCSDLLVDVGGHPMAAGFTVEVKNLVLLQEKLEILAEKELDEEKLTRKLMIDAEISLAFVTEPLWSHLQKLAPFGFGNYEPVFATRGVTVLETRLVGREGKHLKLRLKAGERAQAVDAIAFNFGHLSGKLTLGSKADIAYTIDMNEWNGKRTLQLKVKDIVLI